MQAKLQDMYRNSAVVHHNKYVTHYTTKPDDTFAPTLLLQQSTRWLNNPKQSEQSHIPFRNLLKKKLWDSPVVYTTD